MIDISFELSTAHNYAAIFQASRAVLMALTRAGKSWVI